MSYNSAMTAETISRRRGAISWTEVMGMRLRSSSGRGCARLASTEPVAPTAPAPEGAESAAGPVAAADGEHGREASRPSNRTRLQLAVLFEEDDRWTAMISDAAKLSAMEMRRRGRRVAN